MDTWERFRLCESYQIVDTKPQARHGLMSMLADGSVTGITTGDRREESGFLEMKETACVALHI